MLSRRCMGRWGSLASWAMWGRNLGGDGHPRWNAQRRQGVCALQRDVGCVLGKGSVWSGTRVLHRRPLSFHLDHIPCQQQPLLPTSSLCRLYILFLFQGRGRHGSLSLRPRISKVTIVFVSATHLSLSLLPWVTSLITVLCCCLTFPYCPLLLGVERTLGIAIFGPSIDRRGKGSPKK